MSRKVYNLIFNLAFLVIVVVLCYSLFFAEEKNVKLTVKAVSLFIVYVVYIIREKKRSKPTVNYEFYEKQYRDIINGAFADSRKSHKKLLQAISCYNRDEFKKAHKLLNGLLKECRQPKDYSAVYMFQALCFTDENKDAAAIASYEKLLQHDVSNSRAWSNLGLRYMELGRTEDAKNAYSNAIMYNPDNPYAYNNLATCYVRTGEAQLALDYAQRAMRLDNDLYQVMSAAAMASKMLGNNEDAEKYCRLYEEKGGNAGELKAILQNM